LDGLTKTKKLTTRIKELDMDAVAITDHGAMYGAIEFYKQCLKDEVKPILGMEAYTCLEDHKIRPEKGEKFHNYHLLLLAKDLEGYKNLMKISSIAHLEGYYYRPRISNEILAKYSKGLICTSACPAGELAGHLIANDYEGAKKTAKWFLDVFGDDYYLEVQRHKYEEHISPGLSREIREEQEKMVEYEKRINKGAVKLSNELGIPIVATNDAHYLNREDAEAQDALVCVATGKEVADIKRIRFIDTPEFYVKSTEQMAELFADIPEALKNTVKIAEKCNLEITLNKWYFPNFETKTGSADIELKRLAISGLKERFKKISPEIKKRLNYELKVIREKGYSTYFLINADMARWAKERGIVTNTRGSAAGSLVSYCIGIIDINPLDYNLPFERFLTPWRPSPPDIDFDIADDRREEVIGYLEEKYGRSRTAQICTFGRMLARAAARDVARVLGYEYAVGDRISKLIPPPKQGFPIDIPKALDTSPELKALYDSDADAKKILDLAHEVEGSARHVSVHAAGVVIAPDEITNFTPIQKDPKGGRIITQYDMKALDPNVSAEAVGLLKFDLLGLRNLSILGAAVDLVKVTRDIEIDLQKIPLNDVTTFKMLGRGETMGTFQLSGGGMTKYLVDLKPTKVEDLMAMVALYRPGPISFIPEYISRKNNPRLVEYFDPRMKEYLDKSYGLLVYQDDVLLTAINLAGYTWEESDKFRKAIGKKIPEEMAKQHEKFVEGCVKKGMKRDRAEELFRMIETFAAYGFNKAHAASYGMVAYKTSYMKANYPVEYMCALMTAESSDTDKITAAISECKRMGIIILPPDISESNVGFTIVEGKDSLNGQAIRFGLSAIKNVGRAAIEAILEARESGKFISLSDFFVRVDGRRVNKKVLESLVRVGALSSFGPRAAVLEVMDEVREKVKPRVDNGQQGLFDVDELNNTEAIAVKDLYPITATPEFSEEELERFEVELLGFSLSARPIDEMLGELLLYRTHRVSEVREVGSGVVKVAGLVTEFRQVVTKKSAAEMAFVTIKDETGSIDVVVFPKLYSQTKSVWAGYPGVLVSGKLDNRDEQISILVDKVETQEALSENRSNFSITIPKKAGNEKLKKLKDILKSCPGEDRVVLVFEGSEIDRVAVPFGVAREEKLSSTINKLFS
jgi:DNA polymerase-3 subunit alpha